MTKKDKPKTRKRRRKNEGFFQMKNEKKNRKINKP